jgi:predicted nucleotide-binding protein
MAKNRRKEPSLKNQPQGELAGAKNGVRVKTDARMRRVFITHGKNKSFVEPIKKLLQLLGFEAVVAEELQSVAQPVPDKVLANMRSCGAAIIHVDSEYDVLTLFRKTEHILNPNVLIEIGAAMALYGRRFIILVKGGVGLPSNLQGLYEVRYSGQHLDASAAYRLGEAINDLKNYPLPASRSAFRSTE